MRAQRKLIEEHQEKVMAAIKIAHEGDKSLHDPKE
jgi:hypothetical protein